MAETSVLAKARPLVMARAFSAGVTFFIPLVLARLLEVPDYGTFKQFFLLANTLYLALTLGMPQSLYYFLPRAEGGQQRSYLGQTLIWLGVAGLGVGTFLYLATPVLHWIGGPELAALRLPMAIFCGCLLGSGALEAGLTAQGKPGGAAIAFLASDVTKTAFFVAPALLGHGLHGVLWGSAIFASLRLAAAWLVHGRTGGEPILQRTLFREQVKYALPFGAAMLLAMPQQQFHQYVVSVATNPAVFAIYAVGCFNLPVVDLLYSPTSELLMYRIGELERLGRPAREAVESFREAAGKLSYAFLPMAAGLFAIAPSFISLLYTEKFAAAAPIFRIALVVVVLACFPVDGVLRAKAKTRTLLVSYVSKAAFTVPVVLGLFHALGPIGAMAGFALTETVHKIALLCLASRALLPEVAARGRLVGTIAAVREALPARHFARAGIAAGGSAALALAAEGLLPFEPLLAVLIVGTGFWLLYFAALVASGVRPAAILAVFRPRG
ncbi:lipopolysaccharide biosynthesis protein [Vulgatibacter sp.]|uniref:lipopolysaccharide biosynthesis protein n=1 Tax=Vulgatibacter sp. TaxID=1971226 RepID=UPI003561F7B1